ncbi:MAG: Ig-like domain-containing protein [Gammaproteobacteria bacterium]|nr:Ig-like domain-containing protein [Gammaproteobacteria bacterium]MDE0258731.1 Ig-like domain-containing protein [Gammaproteobacteria bacterium]
MSGHILLRWGARGRERLSAGFAIPGMAVAGIAMLVLSCGDGALEPPPPPPAPVATTVTINPASATLTALEETARFTAEVRDQNGQVMAGTAVAWASSDASVAAVDASGLVTAVANGTATMTAASGSARGTARITVDAPPNVPPYHGTVFLDPDIIVPSDPTDFVGLEAAGRGERLVYDRRPAAWITIQAYLFDATFANGLSAEFQVNPEFGTRAEAEAAAREYASAIGQMPAALRDDVDAVWIHRGDEAFGGGNRSLLVHTDRGEQYRQQGFLPEVFIHEGVHTSLDSTHAAAPGWLAAQAADPTSISTYARDYPGREDLAESFSAWLAVRHRGDRITAGMADTIAAAIPHRLVYFDSLDLNLCPVVTGGACGARARWTLSGTVSHGWADPESGPSVANPGGRIVGAVVEAVDGPDAGRQATTDDHGRYVLESLEEAQFTVRAAAEGFASVDRTLDMVSDTALAFAISRELSPRRPPAPFPDTDPEWLQTLSSDYPHVHHVANVRVFSDISPTFSEEHAEHLGRVWDFFDALYAENRGRYIDAYYTADSTVFKKVVPHCPTIFIPGARNVTACYLDYPRWFIMPYQIPDLGTQLHEVGHDFVYATWPQAWDTSKWFVEGTAMYFEGGVFTDGGSLRVPAPYSWCNVLFQRFDREDRLMSLGQLLRLSGDAFLADNWRTYSQSCMLFDYLERHEPGVLYALIQRINAGQIASNDQLIAALLELTGNTVNELEEAYESYARIAGGR